MSAANSASSLLLIVPEPMATAPIFEAIRPSYRDLHRGHWDYTCTIRRQTRIPAQKLTVKLIISYCIIYRTIVFSLRHPGHFPFLSLFRLCCEPRSFTVRARILCSTFRADVQNDCMDTPSDSFQTPELKVCTAIHLSHHPNRAELDPHPSLLRAQIAQPPHPSPLPPVLPPICPPHPVSYTHLTLPTKRIV